ncbi:MAG: helix-turn-helix domain-containing protein [Ilumatobacteraceae bacterium]
MRCWQQCAQPRCTAPLDRLIEGVERELGGRLPTLSREDKQRAIRLLDDRGAFILRRAVEDVADAMGVKPDHRLQLPQRAAPMTGTLVVVPYDTRWPVQFRAVAADLAALAELERINT